MSPDYADCSLCPCRWRLHSVASDDRFRTRVNAMAQTSEVPGRYGITDDRLGLALAAEYDLTDRLQLSLEPHHREMSGTPDCRVGRIWVATLARRDHLKPDPAALHPGTAGNQRLVTAPLFGGNDDQSVRSCDVA